MRRIHRPALLLRRPPPVVLDAITGLFAGGVGGAFWDFTDLSTLYSDAARTTLATSGGPVRGVADKSGNGRHLSTTSALVLRNATAGIDLNSSPSEPMLQSTLGQTGSASGWTSILAAKVTNRVDVQALLDGTYSGELIVNLRANNDRLGVISYGTTGGSDPLDNQTGAGSIVDDQPFVFTASRGTTQLDAPRQNFRFSGSLADPATTVTDAASIRLGIGASWGGLGGAAPTLDPMTGRFYAALFVNRLLTTAERDAAELAMAARVPGGVIVIGGVPIVWSASRILNMSLPGDPSIATEATTSSAAVMSDIGESSGKKYFEVTMSATGSPFDCAVGFRRSDEVIGTAVNAGQTFVARANATSFVGSSGATAASTQTINSGNTVRVAIDFTAKKAWVGIVGSAWPNSGDPAAGTNPTFSGWSSGTWHVYAWADNSGGNHTFILRSGGYLAAAPSGFDPWMT